ncbi:Protein ASIC-2, partial [Aphelenchoides avenae]
DSIVDIVISLGNFPSNAYTVLNGPDADLEYACNNPNSVFGTDIPRCIKWYRENSAVLNVFYDGLDFEKNTEKQAYTIGDAANDLGGQTGLFLGVSIISVVEVIMLFIITCGYCITGRRSKVEPVVHEVQLDPRAARIKQLREELDEHERLARALRDELLNQAEREEQAREAQAAHDAAVRAAADAANVVAAAGGHAGVPRV